MCRPNSGDGGRGGKGEQARKDQGTSAVLARGDVQVGVGRRGGTAVNQGGGDGAQPWRQCSGVTAHRWWIKGGGKAPGE
jgi:hypothetical protein